MRTFLLNGTQFNEGDLLTITAPELGTITAPTFIQPFTNGLIVGLDLGWIQTAHPCRVNGQPGNARLSLYSNGKGYHSLQVAYLCQCHHFAHNRSLRWLDIVIEGASVRTGSLGTESGEGHNHHIDEVFAHLRPQRIEPVIKPLHPVPLEQTATVAPLPVPKPVKPDPEQKMNGYGQLQLF